MYRVGSVSKLFTDIALMRLVEQGKLDLDAPVTRYLPDFHPANPFGGTITLRQLMTHHAGLVREPPVGSYFDSTAPPLAAIVASLNRTTLVYRPGTRYKYSNAGAASRRLRAGTRRGTEPFPRYLRDSVLIPLGMTRSAFFEPGPDAGARPRRRHHVGAPTAAASPPRRFAATRPAARSTRPWPTWDDSSRACSPIRTRSCPRDPRAHVRPTAVSGSSCRSFDGHRRVGHDGAIYGFATTLAALPDDRLGVVVVTTLDGANAVTDRMADAALRAMLAPARR